MSSRTAKASSCGWRCSIWPPNKQTVSVGRHSLGRRRRASVGRRQAPGVCQQRERHQPPAPARHGHAKRNRGAEAACRRDQRLAVARKQSRFGFRDHLGPIAGRRLFARRRQRASSTAGRKAKPADSTPSNSSSPQLIKWKTFDDREISGFLYQPPKRFTGKRPVIVNIHGGPEGQSRPIFLARNNFYHQRVGRGADLSQHSRLVRVMASRF